MAVPGSEAHAHGLHSGTSALRGIPGLNENDRLIESWLRVLHPKTPAPRPYPPVMGMSNHPGTYSAGQANSTGRLAPQLNFFSANGVQILLEVTGSGNCAAS
jgi:hypothetical protein